MDLKKYRKNKNMTQQSLADAVGCDRTMIGKIENNDANPGVRLAMAIADVLEFDWTLFYEDMRNNGA